jgi:hypothetical protein
MSIVRIPCRMWFTVFKKIAKVIAKCVFENVNKNNININIHIRFCLFSNKQITPIPEPLGLAHAVF